MSVQIGTAAAQTVLITPRYAGQTLTVGSASVTSTRPEQELRLYGSGAIVLSEGDWDCFAILEGEYTGPWFDGSNPPSGTYASWDGAPDASTSTLRQIPADAVWPGWTPGRGVPQVVVDDPSETVSAASCLGAPRRAQAYTLREVGR